jgi:hypothetical protein
VAIARERMVVGLPVLRAFGLWIDPSRWQTWVDGFGRVVEQPDSWPEPGSKLVWESRPNGRGRVTEKSIALDPPGRVVVDVFDEKLVGRQTVTFHPVDDHTEVTIELDYALTREDILRPIVDVFFIRPRLRESLRRTLRRFATEAAEDAALPER